MASRTNPTLIGAFVLSAFLLAIAALVLLGGKEWFVEKHRFVIFFDNSIKGLGVGAVVTFKGVVVGRVASSPTVRYIKETGATEISVLIDLDSNKMVTPDDDSDNDQKKLLAQMITQGLRAQLNAESLITNQQTVLLDFFPETPMRMVTTTLPYPQIPSVPSTFDKLQAQIAQAAQSLPELTAAATQAFNELSAVLTPANQQKFAHILDNIDRLTG